MPEPGSNRARRARPASTTTLTPGMVSEVSAIDVASTIRLRAPGGASARPCAARSIAPNKGVISASAPSMPGSMAATRRISPSPGRKARMVPPGSARVSASASAMNCAAWRIRGAPAGAGRGSQRVSTGKARPSERMTGASSRAATGSASSVADITTMARSGRSAARASHASARPRSAFRLRSWNSSKIRQPTPGKSGSDWIMRVRIPSVTTSIRRPGTDWPRTRKPTVAPGDSPSVSARRAAAARAARRRGSSMTMRPGITSRSARGTRVVLPAPGGAVRTARPWSASARRSAGSASSMGRGAGGEAMRGVCPESGGDASGGVGAGGGGWVRVVAGRGNLGGARARGVRRA